MLEVIPLFFAAVLGVGLARIRSRLLWLTSSCVLGSVLGICVSVLLGEVSRSLWYAIWDASQAAIAATLVGITVRSYRLLAASASEL
jgi:hypothetical protein